MRKRICQSGLRGGCRISKVCISALINLFIICCLGAFLGASAFAQGPEKIEPPAAVLDQEVKPTPPQAVDQPQQTTTPAPARAAAQKKEEVLHTRWNCGRTTSPFQSSHRNRNHPHTWLHLPVEQERQGFSAFHNRWGWTHYKQRQPWIRRGRTVLLQREHL